ncbi:MAG: hypothetical protein ACOYT8_05515 [Candidatus Dependentiae bacterium]
MLPKSLLKSLQIFVLLIGLSINVVSNLHAAQPGLPANSKGMALSQEDIKMLNEVEQEINKFVATLSPEEQQAFWKDVDELTKVMSTMSEDELVKFMEDVFQEQAPAPTPPVVAPPAPAPVEKPVIEEPKPIKPEMLKAQERALILIDSLITKINNFIGKTQLIPDLSTNIKNWAQGKKLKNWPSNTSWSQFKSQIEELEVKLNRLKERNPKTNQYRHLDEFIKNEALYNNLSKLNSVLSAHEPKIELPSFVLEKMSEDAKTALRTVIDSLVEAVTILQIPTDIEAVFEKYEPIAKTIKEQEEAAKKRAAEAPGVKAGPTIVGGRKQEPVDRFKPEYLPEPYFPPYQPDFFPSEPAREPKRAEEKAGEKETKQPEAPAKKEDEKKEEKKAELDKVAESHITTTDAQLTNIAGIVDDFRQLKNLKDFLYGSEPVSKELITEGIAGLNKAARDGRNALRSLKLRMSKLNDKEKEEVKLLIKNISKEYGDTLNRLSAQIEDARLSMGGFSPEKQWAFFGIEPSDTQRQHVDDFKKNTGISTPVNLLDLKSRIDELKKALDAI